MGEKEVVPGVRGRVLFVGKYSEGEIKKGARIGEKYQIQNIEVQDGTGKIKVMVNAHGPIEASWKGREIVICSHDGPKGLTGCYRDTDTYQDANAPMIRCTASAEIDLAENAQAPTASAPGATVAPAQPPAPMPGYPPVAPPGPAPGPVQRNDVLAAAQAAAAQAAADVVAKAAAAEKRAAAQNPLTAARKGMMQSVNAALLSFDAAVFVANAVKEKHGLDLGPDAIERLAVSFLIEAGRRGFTTTLPTSPTTPKAQPAPAPSPAPLPVPPPPPPPAPEPPGELPPGTIMDEDVPF